MFRNGGTVSLYGIPKTFASEVGLRKVSPVEISFVDGKLVITPVTKPSPTLKQLLAKVTKNNLHDEVVTDSAVGNEAW